jgi:hypothetical protein
MDERIVKLLRASGLQYLFIAVFLMLPQAARAQPITTGEDLHEACNSAEQFEVCVFYLKTVYQTAKAIDQLSDAEQKGSIGSCGPEQGIDTVPLVIALRLAWQEYAARSPERMQNLAAEEALLAFEERWPCKR